MHIASLRRRGEHRTSSVNQELASVPIVVIFMLGPAHFLMDADTKNCIYHRGSLRSRYQSGMGPSQRPLALLEGEGEKAVIRPAKRHVFESCQRVKR